jgi:hypothetical protein
LIGQYQKLEAATVQVSVLAKQVMQVGMLKAQRKDMQHTYGKMLRVLLQEES